MLERILTYFFKGIIYSAILAVLGMAASFILKWHFLKGAYIFVLGAGILTMIVSIILLIGTPKMRGKYLINKEENNKSDIGGEGIGPAFMGIVMMVIGFIIEALMH